MITSSLLLAVVTFAYLFCAILYVAGVIFHRRSLQTWGSRLAAVTLVVQTAGILLRWNESYRIGYGHAPLSNLYESLVFGAWAIMLIYLVSEYRSKTKALGVFPSFFAFLAMAYASFSTNVDSKIQPLLPALKSNWLIAHVVTCFLGYAAFAVSCGISALYLLKTARSEEKRGVIGMLPPLRELEEINYQMILFGFLWLSVGIITGSVWANSAWGTYWSWDPKETWSLITWFIYAAILHTRAMKGRRGSDTAWLSILGFACVLFTYFGVNFLLSGLHSYGTK